MKSNRLALVIAFLFGTTIVRADLFDRIASESETNKLSATNFFDKFGQDANSNKPSSTNVNYPASFVPDGTVDVLKAKAEKGDAEAQYSMGHMYLQKLDFYSAEKWLLKAASAGWTNAMFDLSFAVYGIGSPLQNDAKSFYFDKLAADAGDADEKLSVGFKYIEGQGVGTNRSEGLRYIHDGMACLENDLRSLQGNLKGPQTNRLHLLSSAINCMGHIAGYACQLGDYYHQGEFLPKDPTNAILWYQKCVEEGEELRIISPEYDLLASNGVTSDNWAWGWDHYKEWYVRSAFEIGYIYNTEMHDYHSAIKWYCKAAEQGNLEAQCNLGVLYHQGEGVPQDYAEAIKWFRKAADQGYAIAQSKLGVMYDNGEGVPQDYVEAYKWYNLAAAQGQANSIRLRDILARSMTPDQIAEAQQLSREFKPRAETSSSNSVSPDKPASTATGFFITDDGYLISNYHVVKDATKVRVLTGAGTLDAKVVQTDAANDLALLKADGRFAPLPIATSRSVQLGNTVATVGFPDPGLQGFSPKLAKGEIAALAGAGDDARYFQISVPVQPGNSGGALVDEHGNVVGIVSAKLNAAAALTSSGALPENVNYAVKSSFLLSFLESVPDVAKKLKEPFTADRKFEDVVKSAQSAAVLVLVY